MAGQAKPVSLQYILARRRRRWPCDDDLSELFIVPCCRRPGIHHYASVMPRKVFRIGTLRYNWPMSAHASQAFSIAHCTDSEDLTMPLIPSCHMQDNRDLCVLLMMF